MSFFFLPYFVLAPQKVSMLINLGSLCILLSFGALKGFYNYFVNDILYSDKRWLALAYFGSILLSIYTSLVLKSYIYTIGSLIIEVNNN